MAQDFIEQFKISSPVYVDSKRVLYKALGLTASKMNLLNPKSVLPGIKTGKKGFVQGKVQGDPWQLGGVILLKASGEMPYVYRSSYAGDHPDLEQVIEKLKTF